MFDTDGFQLIMQWVERESGVAYNDSEVSQRAHRVLADHGRAVSFLIAEGIEPSNEGRGYICRRLLRRAIYQAKRIGLDGVHRLPAVVIEQMGDAYPDAARARSRHRAHRARRGGEVLRDARARDEGVRRPRRPGGDHAPRTPSRSSRRTASRSSSRRSSPRSAGRRSTWTASATLMDEHREVSRGGGDELDAAGRGAARRCRPAADRVRRLLEDERPDRGDRRRRRSTGRGSS